jgi:hypothetical protein
MPRDASGSTNGRSKTYEALVKSLFTNMAHVKESDVPPRPQSRIGFRRNNSFKIRHAPQRDSHDDDTTGATPSANSDEDTADSETSDEWSTDSDTSDTTFSSDLPPCFPVPSTSPPPPPPILVPDAFPEQADAPASPSILPSSLPIPTHNHHRPMFPHHGLSRSALQHQKWLWNTRYDEWMQWRADVDSASEAAEMGAYGGITNPAAAIEPPPPLRRTRAASSLVLPEYAAAASPGVALAVDKKAEMNEKIFPRTGDLTDLHDPQAVRLDQTFCNYPLWTIQKVLFVCSMDTAAAGRGEGPCLEKADDEQGERDTLADSTIPLLEKLRWEQSWHTRWEVLTALVRMTERAVLARGRTTIPATVTTPIGLPVVARSLTDVSTVTRVPTRFFLEDAERLGEADGSESDDDDDEEDDEDDYGEIILNPRFSLPSSVPDGCGLKRPILLPLDARRGVKALRS